MGCCAFSTKDDTIDNKDGFDIAIKYPSGIDGISINPQGETNEIEDINVWIKSHFKNKSISWIVYNNEHDDKEHSSFAHSKGIVSFEKNNIIWLIHSVPNYPATFDENGPSNIEDGSHIYGQSFICLKLDLKYKDLIIEHLKVQHAYITITNIPKYNEHFEKVESFTITINGTIIHLNQKNGTMIFMPTILSIILTNLGNFKLGLEDTKVLKHIMLQRYKILIGLINHGIQHTIIVKWGFHIRNMYVYLV